MTEETTLGPARHPGRWYALGRWGAVGELQHIREAGEISHRVSVSIEIATLKGNGAATRGDGMEGRLQADMQTE